MSTDTTAPPGAAADSPPAFGLLVSNADAPRYLGLSRAGFYRVRGRPDFPRPVRLPGVALSYRRADLERWVERLKVERATREQPRQLRDGRRRQGVPAEGADA